MSHYAKRILFKLAIVAAALAPARPAAAQAPEEAKEYGSELSGHVGSLLPNQIKGVTEILPVWGLRYGFPLVGGVLESGVANSHAEGVDFTTFSSSLRGDIDLVDKVTGIFYFGPDLHWYRPITRTDRIFVGGFHVGGGLMMHVMDTLWLRSEMKFSMMPGTSLYIGFGLVLRAPASGGG